MPILLMEREGSEARRGENLSNKGTRKQEGLHFKYKRNYTLLVQQPEERVCCTLAREKQQAGYQHPVTSCEQISAQPLQPWQWKQRGISWAEMVLMATDFIVFALLYHPHHEKTFPRVLVLGEKTFPRVLGARGQAQPMSVQHSTASLALLPANLVTELLVTHWGLWATLAPAPGFGGGSRDASAACGAWQRSKHLDGVAAAAMGAQAARLELQW